MTPEGRVKKNINQILKSFPSVYSFMPVQHGLGAAGLDYHCVVGKLFQTAPNSVELVPVAFFIEAKKPGDAPTYRQGDFINERKVHQNAKTFIIDEDPSIKKGTGLDDLVGWLGEIENNNERLRSLTRSNKPSIPAAGGGLRVPT